MAAGLPGSGETYLSPAYCERCGNLEFYVARNGWWCHWCQPQALREVRFPARSQKGQPPVPTDVITRRAPAAGFFSAAQTLAAWPPGWTPPAPCGPATGAVLLRKRASADHEEAKAK